MSLKTPRPRTDTSITIGAATFDIGKVRSSPTRIDNFIYCLEGGLEDDIETTTGTFYASKCRLTFSISFGRIKIEVPNVDVGRVTALLRTQSVVEPLAPRCGVEIVVIEDSMPIRYRIRIRTPVKSSWSVTGKLLRSMANTIITEQSTDSVTWEGWRIQTELITIPRALFVEFVNKVTALLDSAEKIDN